MTVTRADVATERPERYAKQLASHLGRRGGLDYVGETARLTYDGGSCTLTPAGDTLVLEATAEDSEAMDRIQNVVGGHLERFGEKDGLSVTWNVVADR